MSFTFSNEVEPIVKYGKYTIPNINDSNLKEIIRITQLNVNDTLYYYHRYIFVVKTYYNT